MRRKKWASIFFGLTFFIVNFLTACKTTPTDTDNSSSGEIINPPIEQTTEFTIVIEGDDYRKIELGERQLQLTAKCSENFEVVWESHNEAVATVDASGLVTLLNQGDVIITVEKKSDEGVFDSIWLKIQITDIEEEREDIFDA